MKIKVIDRATGEEVDLKELVVALGFDGLQEEEVFGVSLDGNSFLCWIFFDCEYVDIDHNKYEIRVDS